MPKKLLFYSSVPKLELFKTTGFYATDIRILESLGFEVQTTNRINDFLKFWNYQVAFIYFYRFGLVPAILARFFWKKVIFTGGIDGLDKDFMKGSREYWKQVILFKLCYCFANYCIIVSQSDRENIRKIQKKANKLLLIPHVVELGAYEYKEEPKQNIISTIVWMHTISNVQRKGVDVLFRVFDHFVKKRDDFVLEIIGTMGEGQLYLKALADELKIGSKISFSGSVSEVEKIEKLKKSKYYFQLSEYEGFGIAALEALISGNIVFHSNKGGLKDTIADQGIVCLNLKDYESIAEKLFEVEKQYSHYSGFISDGIMHVKNNFAFERRVNGFMNTFKNLNILPNV